MAGESEAFVDGDEEDYDGMVGKYLCFRLGSESYGLPIRFVTEIIELPRISPVPDMPAWIKGFMNLRGSVIPVMDLRLRLGMEGRAYDDRTCVVVTRADRPGGSQVAVGLVVDTVEEVVEIPDQEVEPASRLVAGARGFLNGIGKSGDRAKILIDMERVIDDDAVEEPLGADGGCDA